MEKLPANDAFVQSIVEMLSPILVPFLRQMPLQQFIREGDVVVRDALLKAAREITEQAFSADRPANAAYRKPLTLHSALGPLALVLWGVTTPDGQIQAPEGVSMLRHGCTVAVREQIAVLHALGTTHDAAVAMRLFQVEIPSESTLYRVAIGEGLALSRCDCPEYFGSLLKERVQEVAPQVSLIVVGADGGHVPMRGQGEGMGREWHEGRVVTLDRPELYTEVVGLVTTGVTP